jgi:hypothetical protein
VANTIRNGAAKRARESRRGQDKGDADTPLGRRVPEGQVIHQAGEQAGLKSAEEKAHHRHGRVAVHAAQAHGQGAPGKHEKRDPAAGPQPLEEDVGRYLHTTCQTGGQVSTPLR